MNEEYQDQLQDREPTPVAARVTGHLPHIVTVGRYRVGRVLQTQAQLWSGQAQFSHVAASFDEAVAQIEALNRSHPIDALVGAGASGA